MGRDKGLLDFGGVPLIVHTARLIEPLVTEVTIVGSPERYAKFGVRAIADHAKAEGGPEMTGHGPLAGIATALSVSRTGWILIVACDLPYLSREWVDWLISRALRSRGEVVIPRTGRGMEPLAAMYRRECRATIAAALARGVRKVSEAIGELRVEFVYPREWRQIEGSELILRNMNAPADYTEARKWWSAVRLSEKVRVKKKPPAPKRKRRSAPPPHR
jgi:molybdopterin-guanine dinucleotide biosynthesis protein A